MLALVLDDTDQCRSDEYDVDELVDAVWHGAVVDGLETGSNSTDCIALFTVPWGEERSPEQLAVEKGASSAGASWLLGSTLRAIARLGLSLLRV